MKQIIIEFLNSLYDLKNFLKYSFKVEKLLNKEQYVAFLTKQYHTVEKGFALPEPRLGFGKDKIMDLLNLTPIYIKLYGEDRLTENIRSVLHQYVNYHKKKIFNSELIDKINLMLADNKMIYDTGGVKEYVKSNISEKEYEFFVQSRTSVRNYEDKVVPKEVILKAIEIAKYTPSVCNRQGWKVHVYNNDKALEMLSLQNGNKGFTDTVKTVFVITGDISYFSRNERNQIGIDSGMFSMSLILALHSLGIGTCALNTCVSLKSEVRIKSKGGIPDNEKIIMYMSVGYPVKNCLVAKSLRRETESFATFH